MDRAKAFASLIALVLLAGCGKRELVVGSKGFTEQLILGELAAQQIEARLGVPVTRRLGLGGTLIAHESLVSGSLDLYPEYTGTALMAVMKLPAASDPARVLATVRDEYRRRYKLEWLSPLGFEDTYAMVIRGEDARRDSIATLSDAAKRPAGWRLAVWYEFLTRPDGLAGLQKAYALPLDEQPRSMDMGLLYRALEDEQVDMVAANSTDGLLSVKDFKVLADDRHSFPPYQAAFVVRAETLARTRGLRKALEELAGSLDEAAMRKLNYEVDGLHHQPADVARTFLASRGHGKSERRAPR